MARLKAFLALLAGLLVMGSAAHAQRGRSFPDLPIQRPPQTEAKQPVVIRPAVQNIRVEDGKITADIIDSPIRNVLLEMAERTGVIFEVRTQDETLVSIHLDKVSLQEAIERITSGNNTVFVYDEPPNSDRIKLVSVIPRTTSVQQPGIAYLGTGTITKYRNSVETPEQALQALAGNASVEDREKGIAILVHTRSEMAVKALMNCMFDPAPAIRIATIEGLAGMGARAALPGIVKSLRDQHPGVRQSATTAVALLGDAANIKDLRPLSRDRDPAVAAAAEMAIRKLSTGRIK